MPEIGDGGGGFIVFVLSILSETLILLITLEECVLEINISTTEKTLISVVTNIFDPVTFDLFFSPKL